MNFNYNSSPDYYKIPDDVIRIFHDGYNTYIQDDGDGSLYFKTTESIIFDPNDTNMFEVNKDGVYINGDLFLNGAIDLSELDFSNLGAGKIVYDNTISELAAENVQDAIDEIVEEVHTFNTKSVNYNVTGDAEGQATVNLGEGVTIDVLIKHARENFTVGETTATDEPYSFTTGQYNEAKSGNIVEVGIGTSELIKKNAFEVTNTGKVLTPAQTKEMITDDYQLVTKKYIDDLVIDCGLFILS